MARRYNSGQKATGKSVDTSVDTSLTPPGTLWRHGTTGRWYWRVVAHRVPVALRRAGKYVQVPLVARGRKFATRSRTLAEECRKRLWRQWAKLASAVVPPTMADLLARFERRNRLKASKHHAADNRRIIEGFLDSQGITKPYTISTEHLENYLSGLQEQGRAAATILTYKRTVGAFCKFLIAQDELDVNPADHVEVARPTRRPPRYLTDFQVLMLLIAAYKSRHKWLFDAICFGLWAGLRVGEIAALRWQDIGDRITVGGSRPTKTGDYRYVPIRAELATVIGAMKRGEGRVFPEHHSVYWGQIMAELTRDLPVFGELEGRRVGNQWHLLRSTYAVNRAREKASVWELMAELGHTDPQTTMRYVNVARAGGGK